MRIVSVLALLALAACSTHGPSPFAYPPGHARGVQSIAFNARFTNTPPFVPVGPAPTCRAGELVVLPNPLTVTYGGTQVVHVTACNSASGDRMAAYIQSPGSCDTVNDSKLGTNGDGGSDPAGGNVAVIAGYTPCSGDLLEVSDLVTGAVAEIPIVIVY